MTINLTERQLQVLCASADGKSSNETGPLIGITAETVRKHRVSCMRNLGAKNMAHAVATGVRFGLIVWHDGMAVWLPPSS